MMYPRDMVKPAASPAVWPKFRRSFRPSRDCQPRQSRAVTGKVRSEEPSFDQDDLKLSPLASIHRFNRSVEVGDIFLLVVQGYNDGNTLAWKLSLYGKPPESAASTRAQALQTPTR